MFPRIPTIVTHKLGCVFAAGVFAMLLVVERVEAGVLVLGSSQSCMSSNANLMGGMSAEQLHKLLLQQQEEESGRVVAGLGLLGCSQPDNSLTTTVTSAILPGRLANAPEVCCVILTGEPELQFKNPFLSGIFRPPEGFVRNF